MGNVVRVLGVVLASMLLGLVALFLLLFTICGGLKSADGGGVLAVCLLLIAGSIGLIVFLGRGIATARAASRGLAVPPAGATPAYVPPITPSAPAASAAPTRPARRCVPSRAPTCRCSSGCASASRSSSCCRSA